VQQTRRYILDILKLLGEATVDEIVVELQNRMGKQITAVTVRHHLARLQEDDVIASPEARHRASPGRPQHIYKLTEKATSQFPNNYQHLASSLLHGLQEQLPPDGVNVIMEGLATNMAEEASIPDGPLEERLDKAVEYLNSRGYDAKWEVKGPDYLLHTRNCPYHQVVQGTDILCDMDIRLVSTLLGVVPRRHSHIMAGDSSCAYLIPGRSNVSKFEEKY